MWNILSYTSQNTQSCLDTEFFQCYHGNTIMLLNRRYSISERMMISSSLERFSLFLRALPENKKNATPLWAWIDKKTKNVCWLLSLLWTYTDKWILHQFWVNQPVSWAVLLRKHLSADSSWAFLVRCTERSRKRRWRQRWQLTQGWRDTAVGWGTRVQADWPSLTTDNSPSCMLAPASMHKRCRLCCVETYLDQSKYGWSLYGGDIFIAVKRNENIPSFLFFLHHAVKMSFSSDVYFSVLL